MSKYTIYYNNMKPVFRSLAKQWKSWSEEAPLTESETKGMKLFFRHIGKRFGLIK
jgi:hypothetical protein